jgi:large conductance mechanosensitive channel
MPEEEVKKTDVNKDGEVQEEAKEGAKAEPEKADEKAGGTLGGPAEKPEKKKKESKHRIRAFFSDFKKFISKGNIVDLAVAVVIGAAFGAIVTSLVNHIIMPLISLAVGKDVLAALRTTIVPDTINEATGEILKAGTFIEWGIFIQKIIDFIIIAFVVFIILRLLVSAQKGISNTQAKIQKRLKKKIKKNPELAAKLTAEAEAAKKEAEASPPALIESTDDILKDIRALLTALAPKIPVAEPPPAPEISETEKIA